jgi:hypothetical protein
MESNKKKRKANAFTGWLDHDDEDKVIQVELCDGKAFVHRNFLIHQCRQVELSFQNCPEQTEPFLVRNFSRKTFITFRALLYTNRILHLTHLPTDKEEFVEWCEVYALCDFLEFELGKKLIVDQAKKRVNWIHVPPLLAAISADHSKYLDLWLLLISKTRNRITEMENIHNWEDKVFDCYDSLQPGEGPRDKKDNKRCCCMHIAPFTSGIVSYPSPSPNMIAVTCIDKLENGDSDDDDEVVGIETFRCCKHGNSSDEKRGQKVRQYHQVRIKQNSQWLEVIATLPDVVHSEINRQRLLATSKQLTEKCITLN